MYQDSGKGKAIEGETNEKSVLFNKISPDNIGVGNLENFWFLTTLAALAEKPLLIRRLFKPLRQNHERGLYKGMNLIHY